MFKQVIPDFKLKNYDVDDNLLRCFISKQCECCGEDCEWAEDIKQYYKCPHYCCPYALSQISWCINCGCDKKR